MSSQPKNKTKQPTKGKKNVKPQKKKKVWVKKQNPLKVEAQLNNEGTKTNVIVQPTSYIQASDTYRRDTVLNEASVTEFFSAFLSKLIALNVTKTQNFDYLKFYQGYKHMVEGALKMVQGNAALTDVPRIVADWINGLAPKSIKFHTFAAVSYGWQEFDTSAGNYDSIQVGTSTWALMIPGADNTLWNSPATIDNSVTSADAYAEFLRTLDGLSQVPKVRDMLTVVEFSKYKSALHNDASAFSYSYPYWGLSADGTTGWWNNSENISTITCPMLAKYVAYPLQGPINFISRQYIGTSGGPPQFLAPLCDLPISYFNKVPITYKPIDFQDVVNRLIAMYTAAVIKRNTLLNGAVNPTLPFTYQDFRIIVRQMILANCSSQFVGQFEGPNTYTTTTNYFQPFFVTASTQPSSYFQGMRIPLMLAENLAQLREFTFEFAGRKGRSTRNQAQFIPVWGYYPSDPALNPQITIGTASYDMFEPAGSGGQQSMNLADGSYGGPGNPSFVNLNCQYYQGVMTEWNDAIANLQDLLSEMSQNTHAFCGKIPYCMMATRTVTTANLNSLNSKWKSIVERFQGKSSQPSPPVLTKEQRTSQKKLAAPELPPGTPFTLHYQSLVSSIALPNDIKPVLDLLVLPTVRLDDNQQTYLSEDMWKTSVGELLVVPYDTGIAPTVYAQAEFFGARCVTGIGRDQNDEVAQAFSILTAKGQGGAIADILAGVLGQVLPSGAPVFKTIASMIPI